MSAISFEIKLDRVSKIYQEGDTVNGKLVFDCKHEIKNDGINLWLEGFVHLQTTSKNVGLLETFSNTIKPSNTIYQFVELQKLNKIPVGKSEIPFQMKLTPKPNKTLYESYHGVFIMIQYLIKCEIRRSILNKDLQHTIEIIIENKIDNINHFPTLDKKPITFTILPNVDDLSKDMNKFPDFKIVGTLDSTKCRLTEPLTGKLLIVNSNTAIRSIEISLIRIETCGLDDHQFTVDATEVQKLQIVDGNIVKNCFVPIYMHFPRLFTCASLITKNFKIEFELNLIITFEGSFVVKEVFALELARH